MPALARKMSSILPSAPPEHLDCFLAVSAFDCGPAQADGPQWEGLVDSGVEFSRFLGL
jgi:hypothetical protein